MGGEFERKEMYIYAWLSPFTVRLKLSQHSYLAISLVLFSHSVMSDSATPWTATCKTYLSITNFQSLLKLLFIKSVMPSNDLILCRPLLVPSIFPSIRVFINDSVLHISLSSEYSGLISLRMDCLDLLAVQKTLKSLLQHHSSKASILWCSAFFIVQLSHP